MVDVTRAKTLFFDIIRNYQPKLISCLRRGYSFDFFKKDAYAGITVAIVAFPLAMAFAVASGTTPDRGITTAILASLVIGCLGGTRTQISGPIAAFAVIILSITHQYGYDGLILATLMAGILLILAGFAKLGAIIRYVPYSVITGFTTGLALIVFTGQIRDFFGYPIDTLPMGFIDKWQAYSATFTTMSKPTTLIALGSLIGVVVIRRYYSRIPVLLFIVVLSSFIVWLFGLNVATIGTKFGKISCQLPSPYIPPFSLTKAIAVFPSAITIAFLAGIESLLCAVVADGMTGDRHRSNMELVAQGVANFTAALFGGIPGAGTFARTATNIKAGAQTPISSIIHAVFLFILMTFFGALVAYIPLATLAAILIVVAWDMSDIQRFFSLIKVPDSERVIMVTTFALTVLSDLTLAIQVGIILSSFFFVHRMSRLTNITPCEETDPVVHILPSTVRIYHVHGPFFFGAASRIKSILDTKGTDHQIYILNLERMPLIDATGVNILTHFIEKCRRRSATVIIAGLNPQPTHTLRRMGFENIIPQRYQTPTLDQAVALSLKLLDQQANRDLTPSPKDTVERHQKEHL